MASSTEHDPQNRGNNLMDEIAERIKHPFYPSDQTLCILAKLAYKDNIDPPDGWTIIHRVSNKDGYVGVAFFHEEHHHLVISHQGTKLKKLQDFWADLDGVVKNNYTSQLHSACNFAFHTLEEISKDNKRVSVSITGHSLGGWLSQITAFAIEYLTPDQQMKFRGLEKGERRYHPHTVTFDSPGCYDMLYKLSIDHFHRYEIKDEHLISALDITTYFIAPNLVNVRNRHVGRLLSFNYPPPNNKNKVIEKINPHSNKYHTINNFIEAFETADITSKYMVLDWPLHCWKDDYKKFFIHGNEGNNFDPNVDHLNVKMITVHYKVESFLANVTNINIFTEQERIFLEHWKKLKKHGVNPFKLKEFLQGLGDFHSFLSDFNILGCEIKCDSEGALVDIATKIKWLFVYCPKALDMMKEQILDTPAIFEAMYKTATNSYILNLPQYGIYYKDTIGLTEFLENKKDRIMLIQTTNTKDEAFRVYNILEQRELYTGRISMFSFKDVDYLEKYVDVAAVFASKSTIDEVLVINFEDSENFDIVDRLYQKIVEGKVSQKKVVLIAEKSNSSNINTVTKAVKEPSLSDLTDDTLHDLMNREVLALKDMKLALNDFLKAGSLTELSDSIPFHVLKRKFLNLSKIEKLNFENNYFKNVFLTLTSVKTFKNIYIDKFENIIKNYESTLAPIVQKSFENVIFLITGVSDNSVLAALQKDYEDQIILHSTTDQDISSEIFSNICLKNIQKTVFKLQFSHSEDKFLKWLEVFDYNLYIKRKFYAGIEPIEEEELLKTKEKITLISSDPGMGKSTTLMHLARNVKEGWVFWINLRDAHKFIGFQSVNMATVAAFLLKFSDKVSSLIKYLLKYSLGSENSIPVHIFFDAVDEIQDRTVIRNKIFEILEFLKQKSFAKIFISTRTQFRTELEQKLNVKAIKLKKIAEKEQIEFFTKFWILKLSLVTLDNSVIFGLKTYARTILKLINESNNEYKRSFLVNPLQLKMISEIFQPDDVENIPFQDFNNNFYELYSKFVDKKFEIYIKEKLDLKPFEILGKVFDELDNAHKILGMKHFFPYFQSGEIKSGTFVDLNHIGLVQVNGNEESFVHETLAQYFAAERLVESMQELTEKEQKFVALNILVEDKYKMIRRFMNDKFEKDEKNYEELNFVPQIWMKSNLNISNRYLSFSEIFVKNLIVENCSKIIELVMENLCRVNVTLKNKSLLVKGELEVILLKAAINYSNVKTALTLLNYLPDTDINRVTVNGESLLHSSAEKPSFNFFSLKLLEKGAHANFKNADGVNFLDIACKHENWNLLLAVYKFNENYDCLMDKWKIIFYQAVETNHVDLALKLLDKIIDFNYLDDVPLSLEYGGWNLIRTIIDFKEMPRNLESVKQILRKSMKEKNIWNFDLLSEFNFKNRKNQTLLHFAVGLGRRDIAKTLIENGQDVTYLDEYDSSPLAIAAKKQNWRLFSFLIREQKSPSTLNAALLCVSQYKNTDFALELIEDGADINVSDKHGNTPIILAAKHRHWDLVLELLSLKADVKTLNNEKQTLWHFVIDNLKLDLALNLIENHGINVNSTDESGNTTILLAAKNNNWASVSKLIKLNASLTQSNKNGECLLHYSCKYGQLDLAVDLIQKYNVNVNSDNVWGDTPILLAAENSEWDVVSKLIELGASFTHSKHNLQCFLSFACRDKKYKLVSDFIKEYKVNGMTQLFPDSPLRKRKKPTLKTQLPQNGRNQSSESGSSATVCLKDSQEGLKTANFDKIADFDYSHEVPQSLQYGRWNLIRKLIDLKKMPRTVESVKKILLIMKEKDIWDSDFLNDVNFKNEENRTFLHFAVGQDRRDIAKKLIENGQNVTCFDENNFSPLAIAAKKRNWSLFSFLVRQQKNQLTLNAALLCVIQYKNADFLLELIEHGAEVNFSDKDGNTPIIHAAKYRHWDLVSELLNLKADVKILNNEKRTLWHFVIDDLKLDLAVDLIENHGINVNLTDEGGNTTILLAAKFKRWDLVSKLIKLNASLTDYSKNGQCLLHYSCKYGQLDLAVDLVQNYKVNVNSANVWGDTPVLLAAENSEWDVVSKLIDLNASVNLFNKYGICLLHYACIHRQLDLILNLIQNKKYKVDVNAANLRGDTPILLAAKNKNWDVVSKLIELNANVTHYNKNGRFLLHFLCQDGKLDLAVNLIQKPEVDVDLADKFGDTPILLAAKNKKWDMVSKLIELNASVTHFNRLGEHLLHFLCKYGKLDLIQKQQVDVKKADKWRNNPILLAAENSKWDVVSKLMELNPSLINSTKDRESLFYLACKDGQLDLVSDLMRKYDFNVHSADNLADSYTPILVAAEYSKWDVVSKLIELNDCPLYFNNLGQCLLHFACRDNMLELASDLIKKYKFDVNVQDRWGNTPILYAAQKKNFNLVSELIKLKADPKIANEYGRTVLYWACLENQADLVLSLIDQGCDVHALGTDEVTLYNELPSHVCTDLRNLIDAKRYN